MQYRRAQTPGATYFFTVVTQDRHQILCLNRHILLMRKSLRYVMNRHPFTIDAFVLLPDHLHCIWTLPQGDRDFSKRWRLIKSYLTGHCQIHPTPVSSLSRRKKGERSIWQRRFWEHLIRDDTDFNHHADYIH
jgi:putative transposase